MDKLQEAAFRSAIQPICAVLLKSYEEALVLRARVYLALAEANGAEAEDYGEVIAQSLETGTAITKQYLDLLAAVEKAKNLAKD